MFQGDGDAPEEVSSVQSFKRISLGGLGGEGCSNPD